LILIGSLIIDYLLNHKAHMAWVLDAVGLFATAAILFKSRLLSSIERKHLYLLMGMIGIALIYFTFAFQIYSTLVVFIENHLEMRYFGFKIPSSVFAAIDPFFVIVLSPLAILIWAKCEKSFQCSLVLPKFALSLLFLSAGFCTFSYLATWHTSNLLSLIILGNMFLGAGELCLMPTLIASINQYAPKGMQSTMMGYFFMALAFSGLLSGKLGLLLVKATAQPSPSNYADLYSSISIMALALGLVLISGRYIHGKMFGSQTI
jgi:proton-dependent oligopeptide transporter, POT family